MENFEIVEIIFTALFGGLYTWSIWVTTTIFKIKSDVRVNFNQDKEYQKFMNDLHQDIEEIKQQLQKIVLALAKKQIDVD